METPQGELDEVSLQIIPLREQTDGSAYTRRHLELLKLHSNLESLGKRNMKRANEKASEPSQGQDGRATQPALRSLSVATDCRSAPSFPINRQHGRVLLVQPWFHRICFRMTSPSCDASATRVKGGGGAYLRGKAESSVTCVLQTRSGRATFHYLSPH